MKRLVWLLVFVFTFSSFIMVANGISFIIPSLNYEKYQEFVQAGDLPERFVHYERWSDFGEFKSYANKEGYYPQYIDCEDTYRINVTEDFMVEINRFPAEDASVPGEPMATEPENWLYLRSATEEEKRTDLFYCRSGVYYVCKWMKAEDETYFQGITGICWVEDGNFFWLKLPSREGITTLEEYLDGVDKKHPLRTILSPDATDHDVMVALGILEPDPPLFETWEIVTLAVGGAVVLAGVVTLIVLLVPKKRKEVLAEIS